MRRLRTLVPVVAVAAVVTGLGACGSADDAATTGTAGGAAPTDAASANPTPTIVSDATADATPTSAGPTSADPTSAGATSAGTVPAVYTVATREQTFVDTGRPTPANGPYPGAPDRTIRVRFYAPEERAGAPFPMIVFSHGITGEPESYRPLLEDFARAGYVVVAPSYPLSHKDAPGGPTPADLASQPGDASFVIDQVLAANAGDGWLGGLVDPSRIGADGHSLGGITAISLGFNPTCGDPRVKAVIMMSGALGGCAGSFFGDDRDPLLVIHGDDDQTIPYNAGMSAFADASGPKFLLTIVGGTHTSEELGGTSPGERALTDASIAFFDAYLNNEADGRDRLQRAGSRPGITRLDARP